MQKVMSLIPGMGAMKDMMGNGDADKDMKRLFGIIDSMTAEERCNPTKTIDQSRRRRIAAGSGVEPHEVNDLVKQFDSMADMMKQMAGKGMRERMNMVRDLQNGAMQDPTGKLTKKKQGTGKRLTPKEKAKRKKEKEREKRRKKRGRGGP